jgi:competence protein CoiA
VQYALVDGERIRAEPELTGNCPLCGERMVAKCGTKLLWHWAHKGRQHCDPWWENETDWHRAWKQCFAKSWREQVHVDATGERHIADVKTPAGTVLEFQNSAMPSLELAAREGFYGNMLWIVNGAPFLKQFFILGRLPPPEVAWVQDIVLAGPMHGGRAEFFWRKSEHPDHVAGDVVQMHDMSEIQDQTDGDYVGHHRYDWIRPRSVWFEAHSPVYIDFGGDLLWQLREHGERKFECIQAVRKKTLILAHGGAFSETGLIVEAAKRPKRNGDAIYKGQNDIIQARIL